MIYPILNISIYMTKKLSRMIEVIDEYLYSKIWLYTISKIYILNNLENDFQYILNNLCCCILSTELSTLYILICRKDNLVGSKIDMMMIIMMMMILMMIVMMIKYMKRNNQYIYI